MRALILAGGIGTRLWPLSSKQLPKQFITLDCNQTLLEKTLERFSEYDCFVVTSEKFQYLVDEKVIVEPESKNTAFAITHAIKELLDQGASLEEVCIVSPSDQSYETFSLNVNPGNSIQLFGASPQFPSSEYGYIVVEEGKVKQFIEKPSRERAQSLMETAFWNSGMFAFKIGTFLSELKQHIPLYYEYIKGRCHYSQLPNLSFDKALIEKSKNLICTPLKGNFRDLGSLDALYDYLAKDEKENAVLGLHDSLDSKGNLIITKSKPVSLVDVDDHVVIETDERIYIAPKSSFTKLSRLK